MNDDVQSFGQIINRTFSHIRVEDAAKANSILEIWNEVLLRIKSSRNPNEGRNLADHSRVVDLKNGVLLIEVDHPGWMELLQLYKKFIITGIRRAKPELDVSTLAFRLKGKGGNLFDAEKSGTSVEKVRSQIENRIEQEERALNRTSFEKTDEKIAGAEEKRELPPELAVIFEDLRQNMLTNSKK